MALIFEVTSSVDALVPTYGINGGPMSSLRTAQVEESSSLADQWLGIGSSVGIVALGTPLSLLTSSAFHTVSGGFGSTQTQGILTVSTGSLLFSSTSFDSRNFGIDSSQGIVSDEFAPENQVRFVPTDDENPNVLQGATTVTWNPFPIPDPPPAAELRDRDETRFKKVSSFTRFQPFRIRITRDR